MRFGDADARTVRWLPVLWRTVLRLALFWIGCALLSKPASAQTAGTGALAGSVSDSSGAVMAGVQVTATNEATGETRTVQSTANGSYLLALLLPGFYDVEMAKHGFKVAHLTHVRVFVAERNIRDVRLEIGMVSERIIVEASTEEPQKESSALGRVTDFEQIRSLPLVTRNYSQIIALNPGVAADVTDAGALGPGFSGPAGPGLVSNGATILDNNFQMNGVGINDLQSGAQFTGGIAIPNPDTIEEFRVQTSQYDASFGRNAGANVDVITRSGTKDLHGTFWEFFGMTY
jgi:Carboxypeptidase regulatory-like domain